MAVRAEKPRRRAREWAGRPEGDRPARGLRLQSDPRQGANRWSRGACLRGPGLGLAALCRRSQARRGTVVWGSLPGRWARGASISAGAAALRVFVSCHIPVPGRTVFPTGWKVEPRWSQDPSAAVSQTRSSLPWELLRPPLSGEKGDRRSPSACVLKSA